MPDLCFAQVTSRVLFRSTMHVLICPHTLSFCDVMALFVSEQVAWKIVEDDGEVIWMPYCAGRRKKGEEEEEEF